MEVHVNEDPFKLSPQHSMAIGIAVIALTASVETFVLFSNSAFAYRMLGIGGLLVYASAAGCYILWPWFVAHLDEFKNLHVIKMALLGFCLWVGAEETAHASHAYQTPEITEAIARVALPMDWARAGANILIVTMILAMIEILNHLRYHGIVLYRTSQKKVRRKK